MTDLVFTNEYVEDMLKDTRSQHWDMNLGMSLILHLEDDTMHQIDFESPDPFMALLPPQVFASILAEQIQHTVLNFRVAMCDVAEAVFVSEGLWMHAGDDCDCGITEPNCLNCVVVRKDGSWVSVQVPCDPAKQTFGETMTETDIKEVGGNTAFQVAPLLISVAARNPATGEFVQDIEDDVAKARAENALKDDPLAILKNGTMTPIDAEGNPTDRPIGICANPDHDHEDDDDIQVVGAVKAGDGEDDEDEAAIAPDLVITPENQVIRLSDYMRQE